MHLRSVRRARWTAVLVLAALLVSTFARPAFAIDRRTELAAREAMRRAAAEFEISDYDKAIGRLERALRACGSNKCGVIIKAQLWRDLGAMQLRKGETDDALFSFNAAIKLDASLDLNPAYEADDTRAAWQAAKDLATISSAQQPTGDFTHTPAAEQAVRTPLPVYVEYPGSTPPSLVLVKYKSSAMTTWKKLPLAKRGGGWGALIPCGDVTPGVMRYYLQGFDPHGEPALNSGDPKRPYLVPIRPSIASIPPSLPGAEPPQQCSEKQAAVSIAGAGEGNQPILKEDGGKCGEDAQCKSEVCENGACAARAHHPKGGRRFARLWFGIAGSVDIVSLPAGNDVCLRNSTGQPVNSQHYYCTDPNHGDYPLNSSGNALLSQGSAGQAESGIHAGDVRALLVFDYAASGNFLLGGRLGYVFNKYTGDAAVKDGRAFGAPVHLEARATYVFGEDPLVRSGFAPFVFAALGIAPFDADQVTMVTEAGVAGQRPILAWLTGGPFFIAAGGGARYAFSARSAFLAGLKLTGAIGGSGLYPTVGPEIGVQYGF